MNRNDALDLGIWGANIDDEELVEYLKLRPHLKSLLVHLAGRIQDLERQVEWLQERTPT